MKTFLFTLLMCCISCNLQAQDNELSDLRWLEGTWHFDSGKKIIVEEWSNVSGYTLEGKVYSFNQGDTSYTESLRLVQMLDSIFYLAYIKRNKKPVPFKLVSFQKNIFIFENKEHDFPQRIVYTKLNENKFKARVEGEEDGHTHGFEQIYQRQ